MSKKHNQVRSSQSEVSTVEMNKDAETRMANILDRAEADQKTETAELIADVISESPAPVEEKPAEEPKPETFDTDKNAVGIDQKLSLRAILKNLISEGTHTQSEILSEAFKSYPTVLKSTISTILSDSKNEKYAKFEYLVEIVDGKYRFSDKKAPLFKK